MVKAFDAKLPELKRASDEVKRAIAPKKTHAKGRLEVGFFILSSL
jgi:5-formaminoimidazole-4-carboxamide-1-beta-D-ribofuranosyl 5'-monophosphate synthetase